MKSHHAQRTITITNKKNDKIKDKKDRIIFFYRKKNLSKFENSFLEN